MLGINIATHDNPVFLRLTLLQLAMQTQPCDIVVIHQNGEAENYAWAVRDVMKELERKGTKVLFIHHPYRLKHPNFHLPGLKALLAYGCDVFTKWDHDDFFYANHINTMLDALGKYDWVVNKRCELLILKQQGLPSYYKDIDFGMWNGTGGMSDCVFYKRNVAEETVRWMESNPGMEDDSCLLRAMQRYGGKVFDFASTACYVSHGKNTSTSHWSSQTPKELL